MHLSRVLSPVTFVLTPSDLDDRVDPFARLFPEGVVGVVGVTDATDDFRLGTVHRTILNAWIQ